MENKLELKTENEISNYNTLKRFIDIIISIAGIILAPIFLIISILIKLESDGLIIFKQLRARKNSKPFYIYKFRSMKNDAPTLSTNEFDDANLFITKTGRFIRKTSIDELPQLINILKGDMSIVGPRPVILDEKELILLRQKYNIDIILPGITGLAQINGRDSIGEKEKVKLDYQYLKNRSLILDIKIVFITIFKVLKKSDIKKEI
ncbi:MAG: sugar transferase [Romboutsia sp.]